MKKQFIKLTVFILFLSTQTFAYSGKITYIQGEVNVISNGQTKKAEKNTVVSDGDSLKTGSQSLVILVMDDNAQLKLNENSDLTIPLKQENAVALNSGSVFSKIPKQKLKQQFKVITPTAVMGVRGTQFFTAFGTDDERATDLWMCVEEGSVDVTTSNTKKSVVVNAGQGILVTDKKGLTAPKKYAWTKKLNWNLDPTSGDVENKLKLNYKKSLLKEDYN